MSSGESKKTIVVVPTVTPTPRAIAREEMPTYNQKPPNKPDGFNYDDPEWPKYHNENNFTKQVNDEQEREKRAQKTRKEWQIDKDNTAGMTKEEENAYYENKKAANKKKEEEIEKKKKEAMVDDFSWKLSEATPGQEQQQQPQQQQPQQKQQQPQQKQQQQQQKQQQQQQANTKVIDETKKHLQILKQAQVKFERDGDYVYAEGLKKDFNELSEMIGTQGSNIMNNKQKIIENNKNTDISGNTITPGIMNDIVSLFDQEDIHEIIKDLYDRINSSGGDNYVSRKLTQAKTSMVDGRKNREHAAKNEKVGMGYVEDALKNGTFSSKFPEYYTNEEFKNHTWWPYMDKKTTDRIQLQKKSEQKFQDTNGANIDLPTKNVSSVDDILYKLTNKFDKFRFILYYNFYLINIENGAKIILTNNRLSKNYSFYNKWRSYQNEYNRLKWAKKLLSNNIHSPKKNAKLKLVTIINSLSLDEKKQINNFINKLLDLYKTKIDSLKKEKKENKQSILGLNTKKDSMKFQNEQAIKKNIFQLKAIIKEFDNIKKLLNNENATPNVNFSKEKTIESIKLILQSPHKIEEQLKPENINNLIDSKKAIAPLDQLINLINKEGSSGEELNFKNAFNNYKQSFIDVNKKGKTQIEELEQLFETMIDMLKNVYAKHTMNKKTIRDTFLRNFTWMRSLETELRHDQEKDMKEKNKKTKNKIEKIQSFISKAKNFKPTSLFNDLVQYFKKKEGKMEDGLMQKSMESLKRGYDDINQDSMTINITPEYTDIRNELRKKIDELNGISEILMCYSDDIDKNCWMLPPTKFGNISNNLKLNTLISLVYKKPLSEKKMKDYQNFMKMKVKGMKGDEYKEDSALDDLYKINYTNTTGKKISGAVDGAAADKITLLHPVFLRNIKIDCPYGDGININETVRLYLVDKDYEFEDIRNKNLVRLEIKNNTGNLREITVENIIGNFRYIIENNVIFPPLNETLEIFKEKISDSNIKTIITNKLKDIYKFMFVYAEPHNHQLRNTILKLNDADWNTFYNEAKKLRKKEIKIDDSKINNTFISVIHSNIQKNIIKINEKYSTLYYNFSDLKGEEITEIVATNSDIEKKLFEKFNKYWRGGYDKIFTLNYEGKKTGIYFLPIKILGNLLGKSKK